MAADAVAVTVASVAADAVVKLASCTDAPRVGEAVPDELALGASAADTCTTVPPGVEDDVADDDDFLDAGAALCSTAPRVEDAVAANEVAFVGAPAVTSTTAPRVEDAGVDEDGFLEGPAATCTTTPRFDGAVCVGGPVASFATTPRLDDAAAQVAVADPTAAAFSTVPWCKDGLAAAAASCTTFTRIEGAAAAAAATARSFVASFESLFRKS